MSNISRVIQNNKYKRDKRVVSYQEQPEYITSALTRADEVWDDLKKRIKESPDFADLSDTDKIKLYQEKFSKFYSDFPIVSRYMICMGQYNSKAMRRFLVKCKNNTPSGPTEKGEIEDEWIKRQADYVRFLWESYQNRCFKAKDAEQIWEHAYTTLKKEFADFRELHATIEKDLKQSASTSKAEMVREMVKRLTNNEQKLNESDTIDLLNKLKTKVIEQRRKKLITQIKESVTLIKPTRITVGVAVEVEKDPELI